MWRQSGSTKRFVCGCFADYRNKKFASFQCNCFICECKRIKTESLIKQPKKPDTNTTNETRLDREAKWREGGSYHVIPKTFATCLISCLNALFLQFLFSFELDLQSDASGKWCSAIQAGRVHAWPITQFDVASWPPFKASKSCPEALQHSKRFRVHLCGCRLFFVFVPVTFAFVRHVDVHSSHQARHDPPARIGNTCPFDRFLLSIRRSHSCPNVYDLGPRTGLCFFPFFFDAHLSCPKPNESPAPTMPMTSTFPLVHFGRQVCFSLFVLQTRV